MVGRDSVERGLRNADLVRHQSNSMAADLVFAADRTRDLDSDERAGAARLVRNDTSVGMFRAPRRGSDCGVITGYVLIEYGPAYFLRYAAVGAAWSISFAGMMMHFEGVPFAAAYPLSFLDFPHEFPTS